MFNSEEAAPPVSSDYPGPGSGAVEVTINPGDSGAVIGETLADAGVVKTPKAFVDAALKNSSKAARIQPGRYELKKEMSGAGALDALLDENSRDPKSTRLNSSHVARSYAVRCFKKTTR